jgi:hypothetical protein
MSIYPLLPCQSSNNPALLCFLLPAILRDLQGMGGEDWFLSESYCVLLLLLDYFTELFMVSDVAIRL